MRHQFLDQQQVPHKHRHFRQSNKDSLEERILMSRFYKFNTKLFLKAVKRMNKFFTFLFGVKHAVKRK